MTLFLFEFLDLPWIPESLRCTIRDVMELCIGEVFLGYYGWAIPEVLEIVRRENMETVVELAAGTAPFARRLAENLKKTGGPRLRIEVSDLFPDRAQYQALEREFPGVIQGNMEPLDFSKPFAPRPRTLLLISASFHHVPPAVRVPMIRSLASHHVIILEPARRHILLILLCLLDVFPGVMTPLYYAFKRSPGHLRRIFWCWVVPLAPIMIVWDAVVTCLRTWSETDWKRAFPLATGDNNHPLVMKTALRGQMVSWGPLKSNTGLFRGDPNLPN